MWCRYSYGAAESRSVRDFLSECVLTKHISYITLSLPNGIQNIPFGVVITNYQYLGVELLDMQKGS